MTAARPFLIDGLRKVRGGSRFTNQELLSGVADPSVLDEFEKAAWECLSHWADDDDIRAKDPKYAAYQQEKAVETLADLEALDVGYLASEVRWGEHQATRVPFWVALVALAVIIGLAWMVFR